MPTPLSELAELVGGKLTGDGAILIATAEPLQSAQPRSITFLESEKYASQLAQSQASALITTAKLTPPSAIPVIVVDDPLGAFLKIIQHFRGPDEQQASGIDPRAAIDPKVTIGDEPSIAAFACVGAGSILGDRCRLFNNVVIGRNCKIGADVVLHPGVVLYDDTLVGDRVIIHANSVIGADGFGYRLQAGQHVKVPQLGHVEIGDDVEIGANTTIDRATFQATCIGKGTKIDNLVQIAHNCHIGQHNLLISQMGIAGSSTTGDYVVIAGQVGIVDHAHIGTGAVIGAKAGVLKDVPPGQTWLGTPATPEREQKRIVISLAKLPQLREEVRQLKKQLNQPGESAA